MFSVKSLYLQLMCQNVVPYRKMWSVAIPVKIKILFWLMLKIVLLY